MTSYDNQYSFKYKGFNVKYKICTEKGLLYMVTFEYNERIYEKNIISIGNTGYQTLLLKAMISKRLNFDISDNVKKNHLTRLQIVSDHGIENDIAFHSQCILFVFKIAEKIIKSYGRSFIDYCLFVRKQEEDDQLEDSFENYFLLKTCHLLTHSNFEYSTKIDRVDDFHDLW
jgi:hypothetical protein